MRFAWRTILIVLHDYYPPRVFVFFPLYRCLRCRIGFPMALSNLCVWLASAVLHGGIFAVAGNLPPALFFFCLFVVLSILSTVAVIFGKRTSRQVLQAIRQSS